MLARGPVGPVAGAECDLVSGVLAYVQSCVRMNVQ